MNKDIIYIGIPLISREVARDWNNVTRLFNNTLASIYNQSCDNFKVLVACHEVPSIDPAFSHRTEFITVESPVPNTNWEMMLDKGVKKHAIARRLHELGGGYHMFMDADDLIHCELISYVLNQQHPHGYLLKQGYEFDESRNTLRRVRNFDQLCGSCAIVYFYPEDLPSENNKNLDGYFNQFKGHALWERLAIEHGRPLIQVPFEAAVYVRNTGENHSTRVWKRRLKQKLSLLLGGANVDETIRKNFHIPTSKTASR